MKKKKISNNHPVTYGLLKSELKAGLKAALKPYALKKDLKALATKKEMEAGFVRLTNMIISLEYGVNDNLRNLKYEIGQMKDQFNTINNNIDAFMKRTETNELEITMLGKQHDDLAKYCTDKIAYPVYGRNL